MAIDPIELVDDIREMSEVINERLVPRKPLSQVLGAGVREKNLTKEGVQVETLVGDWKMAPFVNKDGVASPITRKNFNAYVIETPCIKIKAPLTDSDTLLQRRAGSLDFANESDAMRQNALEQLAEDMDEMLEMVALREEWLWSQWLTGTIAYEDTDTNVSWTVDTKKPAANTFTVGTLWSQEAASMDADLSAACDIIQNTHQGPAPNICLCGVNAARTVRNRLEKGWATAMKTDSGILTGNAQLMAQYNELGMRYIGMIHGFEFWEVSGTLTDDKGVETSIIRDDYIEIFSNGPRAVRDRTKYYGRKRGITGTLDGTAIGKMSSRAWADDTADVYYQEVQTRPFFWAKHPQWYVSMKVI